MIDLVAIFILFFLLVGGHAKLHYSVGGVKHEIIVNPTDKP